MLGVGGKGAAPGGWGGFSEEITFGLRPEGRNELLVRNQGCGPPGQEESRCEGTEVGEGFAYLMT